MNRTIKVATVSRYYYTTYEKLKRRPHALLLAYNLTNRLKTLKEKSPYDFTKSVWEKEPEKLTLNPNQFSVGLNS